MRKEKNKLFYPIIALAILVVLAVVLLAVAPGQPAKEETIKIGAIYQETGNGADWGEKAEKGIKLAAERINSQGGINGRLVEAVFEDSQSNAKDAVSAMNKLIAVDGVKIVLSQQSSIVVSLSPIANNNKVILMDTGSTTPAYASLNDFTFRVSYSAWHFAKRVSSVLNKNQTKTIAVLYVNNDYGSGMLEAYKKYFNGKIIAEQTFSETETDFKTQLEKIKEANPEAVVFVAQVNQSGLLLKQKKESGLQQQFYTDIYSIEYQSVLDSAENSAEGVIYASQFYDSNSTNPAIKEFNDAFKKKYNEASDPLSAQAFDGLMIIAQAMKQCTNPIDTECVKEKLYNTKNFAGVMGNITFDEFGEPTERPTMLKTIKDGKFIPYEGSK